MHRCKGGRVRCCKKQNICHSNCDLVVILVKKCELEPKEECGVKQKESCRPERSEDLRENILKSVQNRFQECLQVRSSH